ncbi:hypothetical protein KQI84_12785 [bacterium]|nr:hypothetical protein [bacterium]
MTDLIQKSWGLHLAGKTQEALALLEELECSYADRSQVELVVKCRSQILLSMWRFEKVRNDLVDFLGVTWQKRGLEVLHPATDLMELLYEAIVCDPHLPIDEYEGLLWWLVGDSLESGNTVQALRRAGELISIIRFEEPELALKMARAWLGEAETLGESGHVEALKVMVQELEEHSVD